ncbi:Two-component system sensor histidine kinase [hydrothermal vent metagenome]|uniref:histidine kinase n=1 Tax=hydrothermal vent metagenome TaxID=652676 RepID=A0A3B1BD04_9ZZZZ
MAMNTSSQRPLENWQFILALVIFFSVATFAILWHISRLQSQLIESTAINNAQLLTNALAEFRTLYTSEVVKTAKQYGLEITHDYIAKGNAIPLPATLSMLLGEKLGERTSGSKTSLYSPYPFPWRQDTGGLRDQYMEEAWQFLSQNPNQPFYRFTEHDGQQQLRYATADLMRSDCIQCHNNHPDSPKNDWQAGDLRGILEVDLSLDQAIKETQANLQGTIAIFAGIALLAIIGIGAVTRKLHHASAELQQRVQERTAELASKTKELERSNHELDQFAYVTSHDLKAPLRAIANLSQWIEEDLEERITPGIRKQMELMRGRVHRMEALIDGILQYSRVDRVMVDVMAVDVGALLREIVADLAPPESFSIVIAPDMPVLDAARVRLSQVFANLISNAIKYRARDDGHVQVSVKDEGAFYRFDVADDGPGIAAQHHQQVFKIFQTLQARDTAESTGIGLTLVKKIVEEQGGVVELDSAEGAGSTFSFTWPKQPEVDHAA